MLRDVPCFKSFIYSALLLNSNNLRYESYKPVGMQHHTSLLRHKKHNKCIRLQFASGRAIVSHRRDPCGVSRIFFFNCALVTIAKPLITSSTSPPLHCPSAKACHSFSTPEDSPAKAVRMIPVGSISFHILAPFSKLQISKSSRTSSPTSRCAADKVPSQRRHCFMLPSGCRFFSVDGVIHLCAVWGELHQRFLWVHLV